VIHIKINKSTNEIQLKADESLKLGKSCSATQNKKKISFKILREPKKDDLILKSEEDLEIGKIELKISFKGEINTKSCKAIYKQDGIIYTHFEPYFSKFWFFFIFF
jgi:hypothetical protein